MFPEGKGGGRAVVREDGAEPRLRDQTPGVEHTNTQARGVLNSI